MPGQLLQTRVHELARAGEIAPTVGQLGLEEEQLGSREGRVPRQPIKAILRV